MLSLSKHDAGLPNASARYRDRDGSVAVLLIRGETFFESTFQLLDGDRLLELPAMLEQTLALDPVIRELAKQIAPKRHALFLGRGILHPIAMEGALKLKEISYIHAEAYPAGELKHGPLALVTAAMPVVTVAPNDALLEKLKSNMQEVRARGGELLQASIPVERLLAGA